ncbi:MAG: AGE family epimerase/isomerase [Candidatus Omnitrophica bacterium]|nr:AGE family epimerase/isomerase [Candidatus Omnitrophota bacterium]
MLKDAGRKELDSGELKNFLHRHLLEDILPFWEKYGFSSHRPGIDTCLADDGTLLSEDRYMWSQLRAIWTFSALYNRIEKRELWLKHAMDIFNFAVRCGRDEEGRWCFRVSPEGRILTGPTSIYTDGFAILGFSELYRATGDSRALSLAEDTFRRVLPRLDRWAEMDTAPYAIPPGMKAHGISMLYSHAFDALSEVTSDTRVADSALFHCRQVMDCYLRPDTGLVLEYVNLDGTFFDTPEGRAVVPGHAIESMWFQIHQLQKQGDKARIARAVAAIRSHFEAGWDEKYGGLLLGIDYKGKRPVYWKFHDTKLWWPATETLYALLLAHSISGESWCLDYYRKMHDYAFEHYPVPVHGEWHQRLDRKGRPIKDVIALPVKDPFHLPRSLILSINLLSGLNDGQHR